MPTSNYREDKSEQRENFHGVNRYSNLVFLPDNITRLFTRLDQIRLEESLLSDERNKLLKETLPGLLDQLFITTPMGELNDRATELYWHSKYMSDLVRRSYAKAVRNSFTPKTGGVQFYCDVCSEPDILKFASWSEHDRKKRMYRGPRRRGLLLCKACREQRKSKDSEWEQERERKYVEREKIIQELKTMPYQQYLMSDHWKKTRYRSLRKASFRCQLCNSKDNLQVHHITYERRGCELLEDLIVLCRPCHARFHDKFPDTEDEVS